jgi:hypoxanthine-DNA glycosylase
LGSFPSVASLERGEYYGHERNHFWVLMGLIFGFEPSAPYAERLSHLEAAGIALWDLIASCEREGSLDKDIHGEMLNPIAGYLASKPSIGRIALNGGKAAAAFMNTFSIGKTRGGTELDLKISEVKSWALSLDARALSPDAEALSPDESRRILVSRLPSSSPVPTKRFKNALDKLPSWSAFLTGSN